MKDALDTALLYWNDSDVFTVRDLLSGGVAIFGRTGSGKTSSSGKALARAIIGYGNSGGLILAAKPEDTDMWRRIFADAGRTDDLLIFSPDNPLRFNFLAYEMQAGGHTRNITRCITTIGDAPPIVLRTTGAHERDGHAPQSYATDDDARPGNGSRGLPIHARRLRLAWAGAATSTGV